MPFHLGGRTEMSPISNTGPSAPNKSGRQETVLTLTMARQMIPLIQRIIQDILSTREDLNRLIPEQERLEKERRSLNWPERVRRYHLQDDITAVEKQHRQALEELDNLGVTLVDQARGQIGFPTLVNDRRAFFSWKPGEEKLKFWHFWGEKLRRPIPASWFKESE